MASGTTAASRCRRRSTTAAETFRAAGLPDGRLRVGLPARSAVRIRSRIRAVRRPSAPGQRPPADAVRRALRRRDDRRGAKWVGRTAGGIARRPGSSGCTTTIRTRRTSRRRICRSASATIPYDGEIAFVDRQLDRLLQQLDDARRHGAHADARHGRSRRKPGRARRRHARPLRVRRDASRAVDHGGPGHHRRTASRKRSPVPSTCCRRCSTTPASRRRRRPGWTLASPSGRRSAMADAPAYAESLYPELELGWAPLHAMRARRA